MFTEIVPFLSKHWLLSSSFFLVLCLFIWHEYLYHQQTESYSFDPEQLVIQMNHNLVQVLDIRSAEQHQSGCILGSVHVDADALAKKAVSFHKKSPSKILVLIGETGHDVAALADKIRTESMPVRYLAGGMQAWREAQLPTVKDSKK
jgi:rhodanese-related sulfurtransferase